MYLKRAGITILASIGVLIVILGGVFLFAYKKGIGTGAKAVPGAVQYIRPTATASSSLPAVFGLTPRPNPLATPTPAPVSFRLIIEQNRPPENSVFLSVSVQVYLHAELSNRGDFAAHNVNVTARARVGNDYVAIDGKQALIVSMGTLAARVTEPKDITFTLSMSLSQGQAAQSRGIYFEIVVTSTEGDSYIPLMLCNQVECAPA